MRPVRHVLVTGGLGFIGSSVVESFVRSGVDVTVVDDCSSNVIEPEHLPRGPGRVTFVREDVTRFASAQRGRIAVDAVVHAACYVGAAGILPHAGRIVRDTVAATGEVVELCLAADADLVFISSSEVYGRSGVLDESMDLHVPAHLNVRIEYALAKLASEAMVVNSSGRGLRAVSLRPFNVVGPRQSRAAGFVLPTFVQQALGRQPLTVFCDGRQERAFLAVEDLVSAVRLLLDTGLRGSDMRFNVGNASNGVSIIDLAKLIARRAGVPFNAVFVDGQAVYGPSYREAASVRKLCDVGRLVARGWRPEWTLERIVDEAIAHYRAHRDARGMDARAA